MIAVPPLENQFVRLEPLRLERAEPLHAAAREGLGLYAPVPIHAAGMRADVKRWPMPPGPRDPVRDRAQQGRPAPPTGSPAARGS
jgi:hypothetical protein